MVQSNAIYRLKVLVDGRWVSTGDFYVLEQAQERAQLLAVHLDRRVKILDGEGQLVHRETPAECLPLEEESSRNTVILD
jgi:hypothetical protein